MRALLRGLYAEAFCAYRDWYVAHGEYVHKKHSRLVEAKKRVEDLARHQAAALERLDDEPGGYAEAIRKTQVRRARARGARSDAASGGWGLGQGCALHGVIVRRGTPPTPKAIA